MLECTWGSPLRRIGVRDDYWDTSATCAPSQACIEREHVKHGHCRGGKKRRKWSILPGRLQLPSAVQLLHMLLFDCLACTEFSFFLGWDKEYSQRRGDHCLRLWVSCFYSSWICSVLPCLSLFHSYSLFLAPQASTVRLAQTRRVFFKNYFDNRPSCGKVHTSLKTQRLSTANKTTVLLQTAVD